ncbi:unnamed protein product [Cyclocybe aegerita]|uniref:N-acetyltransferase domain-containing protein n=1 Tax=Cyclocybe aegerita TaxID=1973307 RepID=A0A8S0WYA2_CYCAE|nr:unnamed protein product [Cyclocybe aegerita]
MSSNSSRTPSPTSKTPISTFIIPTPASEDHITRYKEIRLASLLTNPEAFGSRYGSENNGGSESALTFAQWEERVNTPGRSIFAAVPASGPSASLSPSPSPSPSPPPQQATISLNGVHSEPQWAGTLSLLSPAMLAGIPKGLSDPMHVAYPPEIAEAERRGDAEIWMLVGMWVRPGYRGQSVGRILIERAFEFVRQDEGIAEREGDKEKGARKRKDKIVMLRVISSNASAVRLYEKAGFRRTPIDDAELEEGQSPGQSWMSIKLFSK